MEHQAVGRAASAASLFRRSNCFFSRGEGRQIRGEFLLDTPLSSSLFLTNSTRHSVTSRIAPNSRLFSHLIFSTRHLNATPKKRRHVEKFNTRLRFFAALGLGLDGALAVEGEHLFGGRSDSRRRERFFRRADLSFSGNAFSRNAFPGKMDCHEIRFYKMRFCEVRFTKMLFSGRSSRAFCSGALFICFGTVIRARGGCLERVEERTAGAAFEAREPAIETLATLAICARGNNSEAVGLAQFCKGLTD